MVVSILNIAESLRILRVFHDYKAIDLARELDMSPSAISDIEHGKRRVTTELLERYAKVFDTAPSAILLLAEGIDGDDQKDSGGKTHRRRVVEGLYKFLHAIEQEA